MRGLTKIEQGLYQQTKTGRYYVRRYISGRGELVKSLGAVDLKTAKKLKDQELALWVDDKRRGAIFDRIALEVRELKQMKAEQTYNSYEIHLRCHLMPFFSGMPIREVPKHWERYKMHQRKLSQRKLKKDREHLMFILRYAVSQGVLDGIPILPLDRRDRIPAPGREYTNEELNKLLKRANPNLKLKLELQLHSGMRQGEVRQLQYDWIDFKTRMVRLPSHITKTRGARSYALSPALIEALVHKKASSNSIFVFPNKLDPGRPESRTDKTFQRLKKEVGIIGKQHWLRHTAVTRIVRAGIPAPIVQSAVGMSDQVMKRIYLHANEEDMKKMAGVVKKSLGKKK